MSMIQIGCLLVGQTLNITILSLAPLLMFSTLWLRALVFVCSEWHSKINKTAKSRCGAKKNVSDLSQS